MPISDSPVAERGSAGRVDQFSCRRGEVVAHDNPMPITALTGQLGCRQTAKGLDAGHHPAALDPLGVEPGHGPRQKADHRWLLLIRQHLDVRQAGGVIDGDVDLVVADAVGPPLLTVAGDPVPHLPKAGQGLDVDVDQVAGPLPLVAL